MTKNFFEIFLKFFGNKKPINLSINNGNKKGGQVQWQANWQFKGVSEGLFTISIL